MSRRAAERMCRSVVLVDGKALPICLAQAEVKGRGFGAVRASDTARTTGTSGKRTSPQESRTQSE